MENRSRVTAYRGLLAVHADRAAAELAEIRTKWDVLGEAGSLPRLFAAVEAALALHVSAEEIVYAACAEHNIMQAAGDPDRHRKMRGCPACVKEPYLICGRCGRDWPCDEYQAITKALLGEVPDGI